MGIDLILFCSTVIIVFLGFYRTPDYVKQQFNDLNRTLQNPNQIKRFNVEIKNTKPKHKMPLKTNGLENCPILAVFRNPTSLSELYENYVRLLEKNNPDIAPDSLQESQEKYIWLKTTYLSLAQHWNKFNPHNLDIPEKRIKNLMKQKITYKPSDFRY